MRGLGEVLVTALGTALGVAEFPFSFQGLSPSMDDTYAKLRAKYERMRAEGSCEVFPTARPELVESESSTERAFGRCM